MAGIGAFDVSKHFDELDEPLDSPEGMLSPSTRRARAIYNLYAGTADVGVTFPGPAGVGADSAALVTLDTHELTVVDGDYLGKIQAKASLESSGTDAVAVAAAIWFEADDTFSASVNSTDIVFAMGESEAATEKFRMTHEGDLQTAVGVGTVTGNTVAQEYGDRYNHVTRLTLTAFAVGTGDDNADLAIGAKFYTFPAGTILVGEATLKGIFDQASHGTITDGEAGLGTVIGSTAVDTLGEVAATSENIIQGDVGVLSTYVLGTTVLQVSDYGGVSGGPFTILSAGVHDVYLNIAATWPDIAAAEAVTFTGVVTISWRIVS